MTTNSIYLALQFDSRSLSEPVIEESYFEFRVMCPRSQSNVSRKTRWGGEWYSRKPPTNFPPLVPTRPEQCTSTLPQDLPSLTFHIHEGHPNGVATS